MKYFKNLKLNYVHNKYETPSCSAASKVPTNTTFCKDAIRSSAFCGMECDTAILQRLQQFLSSATSKLNL